MRSRMNVKGENRILSQLSKASRKKVDAKCETVSMTLKDLLFEHHRPIEHVSFPTSGVFSLVAPMRDGTYAEIATVGNEGVLGMPVFFGAEQSPITAFCQVPGELLRMTAKDFLAIVNREQNLSKLMLRYSQVLMNQISQATACNGLHSTEQRMARWLLMTHDRVDADEFPLTQEFLAQMLGVRRASVTVCAGILHKGGMIDYIRGRMRIVNRKKLEQTACECYEVVRQEYDRLFG